MFDIIVVVVVFFIDEILLIITMSVPWSRTGLVSLRVSCLARGVRTHRVRSLDLVKQHLLSTEYDHNEVIRRQTNTRLARATAGESR